MFETFQYTRRSCELVYNGQPLDSLLELKFVISIENTHAWLREGLEIYYNIDKLEISAQGQLVKYTPDFLIRNFKTGKAFLVEVKPDRYDDFWANVKRRKVSNRFIKGFAYDWEFRIVWEREIILNKKQQKKFDEIQKQVNPYKYSWIGNAHPNTTSWTNEQYAFFLRNGGFSFSSQ